MRGEDTVVTTPTFQCPGSPPHARGRLKDIDIFSTTDMDHPRMRGEDSTLAKAKSTMSGSPPHARGRRRDLLCRRDGRRDHPRMRGEDPSVRRRGRAVKGSPPHARGRLGVPSRLLVQGGITPACAGKTSWTIPATDPTADHPRMRGEDYSNIICRSANIGSPPHARGRQSSHSRHSH